MSIQFSWEELRTVCQGHWLVEPSSDESGIGSISTDSRAIKPGMLFLALSGDRFDGHNFIDQAEANGASALIVSKPVQANLPTLCVQDTLSAYQMLALYHRKRFRDILVIGITGSSGKTSSKEIIAAIVERIFGAEAILLTQGNTNNHIGVPQNLLRLTEAHRCAVLEMGTNSPGEIELLRTLVLPEIAVLTNIGPVHLEGLGSLEGVAKEKSEVFPGVTLAVLPREFAELPSVRAKLPTQVITTGYDHSADIVISDIKNGLSDSQFQLEYDHRNTQVNWALTGKHMALNAAAGFAIGHYLGKSGDYIAEALRNCRNEKMRMQVIELDGKTYINDAYNANPDSMKALIDWLSDSVTKPAALTVILGDMLELGEDEIALHQEVLAYANDRLPSATVMCFGPRMGQAASQQNYAFLDISDLKTAVCSQTVAGDYIAFKGSRGMGLERLLSED